MQADRTILGPCYSLLLISFHTDVLYRLVSYSENLCATAGQASPVRPAVGTVDGGGGGGDYGCPGGHGARSHRSGSRDGRAVQSREAARSLLLVRVGARVRRRAEEAKQLAAQRLHPQQLGGRGGELGRSKLCETLQVGLVKVRVGVRLRVRVRVRVRVGGHIAGRPAAAAAWCRGTVGREC